MIALPKGFVLAAGFGTRLRPLTLHRAKPAFPFFSVPIASLALDSLAGAGVRDVVVNLHYLGETVVEALSPRIPAGVEVFWSEERGDILGTGGAVLPWLDLLGFDHFFLVNGDTYRGLDPSPMLAFHLERKSSATLSLSPAPAGCEGPIEIDDEGRVVRFLSARRPGSPCGKQMLFTGMHIFSPEAVPFFRAVGENSFCVNREVNAAMVGAGLDLFGYCPHEGYFWSDLGTPESYLSAHFTLLERGGIPKEAPGTFFASDSETKEGGKIAGPSWLGEGAVVEGGAQAGPFAVLGRDARVRRGARVSGSVVWDGVQVKEDLDLAIEAGFGRIITGPGGAR
ncbi:NDP-sugar synthase [bacterium]|nr:MAG: NDP-sugar synthase [bacterium]